MGGDFTGEGTQVYVWAKSLHCLPETTIILVISCTPFQNKKFKKKNNNLMCRHGEPRHLSPLPLAGEGQLELGACQLGFSIANNRTTPA